MKKIIVLLMAIATAVSFTACGESKTDVSISGDYQSQGANEDNTADPNPSSTQGESGKIGDYAVSIVKSELTTSKKGKKSMLVTYLFTNESDKPVKFADVLSAEAYQNNTACVQAGLDDQKYDIENMLEEVKPGETKNVYEAYILQDDSDVTIRVCREGQTQAEEQKDTNMITRVFKVQ